MAARLVQGVSALPHTFGSLDPAGARWKVQFVGDCDERETARARTRATKRQQRRTTIARLFFGFWFCFAVGDRRSGFN